MNDKTLLCTWFGEPIYEETADTKTLIDIIKHLMLTQQHLNKIHEETIDFLTLI